MGISSTRTGSSSALGERSASAADEASLLDEASLPDRVSSTDVSYSSGHGMRPAQLHPQPLASVITARALSAPPRRGVGARRPIPTTPRVSISTLRCATARVRPSTSPVTDATTTTSARPGISTRQCGRSIRQ